MGDTNPSRMLGSTSISIVGLALLCLLGASTARGATNPPRNYNDRMAAWHYWIVSTDEMRPNSWFGTYVVDRMSIDEYALAKLVTGVEIGDKAVWPADAQDFRVEDFPGGVRAEYVLSGVKVTTEMVPIMVGRDTPAHDGAAVFTVTTSPATPVLIRCGEGGVNGFSLMRFQTLRDDSVGAEGDTATLSDGVAVAKSTKHPLIVTMKCDGRMSVEQGTKGGQIVLARMENGRGSLILSFAPDETSARQILSLDPRIARKQVSDYYAQLLRCRVETPVKSINEAFSTALYNLEYNWLAPYGWNECIHHWPALWHMQATAGCEWIGQADRSRDCNLVTAENLFPNGAVPQFMPSGITKRDFGGSNQFFAWQIRHYWDFSADRESIAKLAPALDRVIDQTYEEYDPDHDGLLAWGQQIGNQEDYVSTPYNGTTPSIEGINMLRTAAEVWRALGNEEKARAYDARADASIARLRSELWQPDLGFFAFYKDPHGIARPDGQYHTLIYPAIWGITDQIDSWTTMRHLRDRMIGRDGECYCSNGFPNHVWGTWGMQAGAAQQPWAAMGLARVGLRNETYRPLKAVADWVMNPDHRGSWPEVSTEPTACYFSPPAGLYIQAVVESLFGLNVDRPAGTLTIEPSFPDAWPAAKLELPDYSAGYACKGKVGNYGKSCTLSYTVISKAPLARKLRWMLPPASFSSVKVNGKVARFTIQPGVECVTLAIDTPAQTRTTFEVTCKPVSYTAEWPNAAVEGDTLGVSVSSFTVERIEDRSRVFSGLDAISPDGVRGVVGTRQIEPYKSMGRLGQMNFSRRTFFLWGKADGGVRFWIPVDITVLPRHECATGEAKPTAQGAEVTILIRNNSDEPLKGRGTLRAIRNEFPFSVDVAGQSEKRYTVNIPKNLLALFSPGENRASVVLPGAREVPVTVVADALFREPKLAEYAQSRIFQIPLPEEGMIPDGDWRQVREFYAYGHMPWAWSKPPLEALDGKTEVAVPGLPAVTFKLPGRKMLPVSWKMQRPTATLNLDGKACRKVYLLVIPFLDNHDTWSQVGRVDVWTGDRTVVSRTLSFPGDLDWWCPQEVVGDFSTARKAREDRFGLLPMLGADRPDWDEAIPAAFPQPEFWATCLPLRTASSVMSVIEIDLGRAVPVKSISLSAIGVDPAFGIVAAAAETSGGDELLEGTPWRLPGRFREPRLVFSFSKADDLQGWKTEGNAFSIADHGHLFPGVMTLNSLCKSGEAAVGRAVSPKFEIGPEDSTLLMKLQGGNSSAASGPGSLLISLIDASTNETLEQMQVTGSHMLRDGRMQVDRWRGRKVRLELSDQNTGSAYAWLGAKEVWLSGR